MKKITLFTAILMVSNLLSAQWIQQNTQFSDNLKETVFIDQNNGWAIGGEEVTSIYFTTNGGLEWLGCFDLMDLPTHGCTIYFTDENNGWMSNGGGMGVGSEIWHTNNGELGCNSEWELQLEAETDYISSKLFFIDPLHGWHVGYFDAGSDVYLSKFFYTIDGGSIWIEGDGLGYEVSDIDFIDTQLGWAIDKKTEGIPGPSGLLHTVNGGEIWTSINDEIYGSAICFLDSQIGWIAGYDNTSSSGFISLTNDGGNNWVNQTGVAIPAIHDITFIDSMNGWAVGNEGTILHTADGGQNWEYQESGTLANLNSVCFIDQNYGWICGDSGIILHTNNGGIVGINENAMSKSKLNIHPNPSNETAAIIFELEQKGKITLSIINTKGQEVKQMNLGEQEKGQINLDCSNFSSGVYFINLQTEKGILTEKLIIE